MRKNTDWNDSYYLKVYRLARTGMPDDGIAQSLGVPVFKFRTWVKEKPALRQALSEGRDPSLHNGKKHGEIVRSARQITSFKDYVFGTLPDNLKQVWNDIMRPDRTRIRSGFTDERPSRNKIGQRLRKHLAGMSERDHQSLFVHAIIHCGFNYHAAMRVAGVSTKVLFMWKQDPDFNDLLTQMGEARVSYCEEYLFREAKKGDVGAIKYLLDNQGKRRGYGQPRSVNLNVEGEVSHQHSIDLSKLSLATRKELLKQIEAPAVNGEIMIDDEDTEG
jgi:hypothetical protein